MNLARKGACLLLAATLCVMGAACSQGGEATGPVTVSTAPTAEPTPLIVSAPPREETAPTDAPTPEPAPTPAAYPYTGYIAKEGVNMRETPDNNGNILDVFGENTELQVTALEGEWLQVEYAGVRGYVHAELVVAGAAPRKDNMHWAKVVADEAPLYKNADGTEPSERKLAKDEVVKVLRTLGDYSHVVLSDHLQRYVLRSEIEVISEEDALAWRAQNAGEQSGEKES